MSGKVGLLDSLRHNASAGIEGGRDSGCWSLFSKVSEMLPNRDVGINISVATATLKRCDLVIDGESMFILSILCVASEVCLCLVVVLSLQLYIMLMSLFTVTSEVYREIPSPSSRCVTRWCCSIYCSALATYRIWKLYFKFVVKYLLSCEVSLSFLSSMICIINSCSWLSWLTFFVWIHFSIVWDSLFGIKSCRIDNMTINIYRIKS